MPTGCEKTPAADSTTSGARSVNRLREFVRRTDARHRAFASFPDGERGDPGAGRARDAITIVEHELDEFRDARGAYLPLTANLAMSLTFSDSRGRFHHDRSPSIEGVEVPGIVHVPDVLGLPRR